MFEVITGFLSLPPPAVYTTHGHFSRISESVPFFVKGPQTQCALPGAGQGQETSSAAPAVHPTCHPPQECEWGRDRGWRLKSRWPGVEGMCVLSILWHGACDLNASGTKSSPSPPQDTSPNLSWFLIERELIFVSSCIDSSSSAWCGFGEKSKVPLMRDFYVVIGKVLLFSVLSVPCPSQSRALRISWPHWGTRRQIPLFLESRWHNRALLGTG